MALYSYAEQTKQKVVNALKYISINNGYNHDIPLANIETRWKNWLNQDSVKFPGLFVTSQAEDGDLIQTAKFQSRCDVVEDHVITILGRVRAIEGQNEDVGEKLNYLIQDVKKALHRDLTLGGEYDPLTWQVTRSSPFTTAVGSRDAMFQLDVTYRSNVRYN